MAIKVSGGPKLRRTLKQAGVSLEDLKEVNIAVANMVAARSVAPYRSGKLKSTVRPSRAVSRARIMVGKKAVPYAGPIHWGWRARGIKADPFVSKAAQDSEPLWVQMYVNGVNRVIAKVEGA
jgi:hypothetical protein